MSALAPLARRHVDPRLVDWLDEHDDDLFLPAVAIAEVTAGIAKLRRLDRMADADALDIWLFDILYTYTGRTLPLDAGAAHQAGLLIDRARAGRHDVAFADLAIAGIALANGMTILTRNLRHFAPLGVPAHDPYAALPG